MMHNVLEGFFLYFLFFNLHMIIVFGSINIDMVFSVNQLPEATETVLASSYQYSHGGKGANQALAAARMVDKVALVGCTGDDRHGHEILTALRRTGVMTSGVVKSEKPTGMAAVIYDKKGENMVIVAPGANEDIKNDQAPDEVLKDGNILIMQMETSVEENWVLLARAHSQGVKTIVNLAPYVPVPDDAFGQIDILIMNDKESQALARDIGGCAPDEPAELARKIAEKGPECIITRGSKGIVMAAKDGKDIVMEAPPIEEADIVDTTGAGDVFCGILAGALHEGKTPEEALRYASAAGALACLKTGTQSACPYLGEIEDLLENWPA